MQNHNFEQIKDVLDYSRQLHAQIRRYYDSLNAQTGQKRVKMLLDYLSRHEKHMEESLDQYEHEAKQGVLDVWLQYAPSTKIEEKLKQCVVRPGMAVDEIVKIALEFDDALVQLYKEVVREVDDEKVRAVFRNLIERENQEKLLLVRSAMQLDDM
jgi:rubrerythrin